MNRSHRAFLLVKAAAKHFGLTVFQLVERKDGLDMAGNMPAIEALADEMAA